MCIVLSQIIKPNPLSTSCEVETELLQNKVFHIIFRSLLQLHLNVLVLYDMLREREKLSSVLPNLFGKNLSVFVRVPKVWKPCGVWGLGAGGCSLSCTWLHHSRETCDNHAMCKLQTCYLLCYRSMGQGCGMGIAVFIICVGMFCSADYDHWNVECSLYFLGISSSMRN